ncbi:MAG: hypothetical protein GQ532_03200, partial [Methylomarinum sp.]|nr:hypothetical protein [Methylomarinum sp.]
TSNYFLVGVGTLSLALLAFALYITKFGAIYKSEFILRFRFEQTGNSRDYLEVINEFCKRSNLLHMEPSGDNSSLSLTYDVALNDELMAKDLTQRMGSLSNISEVVLIASKNDVDY